MASTETTEPSTPAPGRPGAAPPRRTFRSLNGLNRALRDEPPLLKDAGRVVPGEGPAGARIAFVGEQPGDQEDRLGRPFAGPAGKLMDEAMMQAGIRRDSCYVTNAVKQFKFVQRGKRRLHQRPTNEEIVRYRWWLELELDLVAPQVIVALGATALFALTRQPLRVGEHRGALPLLGRAGYVTVHPSSILRIPDSDARHAARKAFERDLKKIAHLSHQQQLSH